MQELYGGKIAGDLLSCFSRLWTIFLQGNGFTCGIGDLLLNGMAEHKRAELTAQAERRATNASAEFAGIDTQDLEGINDSSVSRLLVFATILHVYLCREAPPYL